jgi:autoinducer 2-degrading protein
MLQSEQGCVQFFFQHDPQVSAFCSLKAALRFFRPAFDILTGCARVFVMLIVHVHVHVKPESVEAFKQASVANARESVKEPGIAQFDVLQQQDDPTRFVLVEAYRSVEATAAHKETKHYQVWRDAVAPMMAEPRSSVKFTNAF